MNVTFCEWWMDKNSGRSSSETEGCSLDLAGGKSSLEEQDGLTFDRPGSGSGGSSSVDVDSEED